MFKEIFIVSAIAFSASSHATLLTQDYKQVGDGLITFDTQSGLEWLDLTETNDRSYSDVYNNLGAGGLFEGWSYAAYDQVASFYGQFGYQDISFTTGTTPQFDLLTSYLGEIDIDRFIGIYDSQNRILTSPDVSTGGFWVNTIRTSISRVYREGHEELSSTHGNGYGSFLVRAQVPEPVTLWLGFASVAAIFLARPFKSSARK